jgi:MOSC domain-containing protein YiiM
MATGKVEQIAVRTGRKAAMRVLEAVRLDPVEGLVGDHYAGKSGSRQVTLLQAEHLPVVATLMGKDRIDPLLTRRNMVVSGINLLSLEGRTFRLGGAVLEMTGLCVPCERMEENLGVGGYDAMLGHGGITARIRQGGMVSVGDLLEIIL